MDLLKAVNTVLPALGEHAVTEVDPQHPTVNLIISQMELKRRELLGRGWWFNTVSTTLHPDVTGLITLPNNTLSVLAHGAVQRGSLLVPADNLVPTWDRPVEVVLKLDMDFEDLPESAATIVLYRTLVQTYNIDIGQEAQLETWERATAMAQLELETEHLRNKRYSTRRSRRYQRIHRHILGG